MKTSIGERPDTVMAGMYVDSAKKGFVKTEQKDEKAIILMTVLFCSESCEGFWKNKLF
jgi:hypothetical protein